MQAEAIFDRVIEIRGQDAGPDRGADTGLARPKHGAQRQRRFDFMERFFYAIFPAIPGNNRRRG